jgi:hypothetical protein
LGHGWEPSGLARNAMGSTTELPGTSKRQPKCLAARILR